MRETKESRATARQQSRGTPPTANAVDSSTPEGVRRMGIIYSGGEPGPWYRVWVKGRGTSIGNNARFFFGLVRGDPQQAVKAARTRWPQHVGKMELEKYEPKVLVPSRSSKSTAASRKAGGGRSAATKRTSASSAVKAKPRKRR